MTNLSQSGSLTRQIGNALIASHRGRCAPKGEVGATFEHRSTRHTSRKHNTTQRHKPSRETLAAFACRPTHKNPPRREVRATHQIERDNLFEIDNAPITITENGKPTQIPTCKRKDASSSPPFLSHATPHFHDRTRIGQVRPDRVKNITGCPETPYPVYPEDRTSFSRLGRFAPKPD